MITYSVTVNIRKDRPGLAPLYMLLRVGKEKAKISLGIMVDPKDWDDNRKKVKGKSSEANSLNDQIASEYGRATAVITQTRALEAARGEYGLLNIETFKNQLTGHIETNDFIAYAFATLERRKPELAYNTYRGHKSRLQKFKQFRKHIPFNELTPKLLHDYVIFMHKRGNKIGARETAIKTVRTYVKMALLEGKEFKDPFITFRISKGATHREHLELHELKKMVAYYIQDDTKPHHKHVLDLFLFQCYTGFRYGDIQRLNSNMIANESIKIKPEKTSNKEKTIVLPLSKLALRHIENRSGKLFKSLALKTANENIKEVAAKLGINKHLTTHVGRHTFSTLFLELGGNVEVLQQYLGHSDIKTTMIYVHMSQHRGRDQIKVFDQLL
jgi:integrase/recombinase XerD